MHLRLLQQAPIIDADNPLELVHVKLAKYRVLLNREFSPPDLNLMLGGNITRAPRVGIS